MDEFWLYGPIALATAVESLAMSVSLIGEASQPYNAIGWISVSTTCLFAFQPHEKHASLWANALALRMR